MGQVAAPLKLKTLNDSPYITRETLSEQLKVSDSTIKKYLKQFKDLDLIERIGPDKGGHWKVKKYDYPQRYP